MKLPSTDASADAPIALLTVQEAAARLRVSTKSVRRWIASGDLRAHRLGRAIRISEADLHVFLRARR